MASEGNRGRNRLGLELSVLATAAVGVAGSGKRMASSPSPATNAPTSKANRTASSHQRRQRPTYKRSTRHRAAREGRKTLGGRQVRTRQSFLWKEVKVDDETGRVAPHACGWSGFRLDRGHRRARPCSAVLDKAAFAWVFGEEEPLETVLVVWTSKTDQAIQAAGPPVSSRRRRLVNSRSHTLRARWDSLVLHRTPFRNGGPARRLLLTDLSSVMQPRESPSARSRGHRLAVETLARRRRGDGPSRGHHRRADGRRREPVAPLPAHP